jgi:hypothetical protein
VGGRFNVALLSATSHTQPSTDLSGTRFSTLTCADINAVYNVWSWLTGALDANVIIRKVEIYHASTDLYKKTTLITEKETVIFGF